MNIPKFIIIHHSVSPRDADIVGTENSINENHKKRFELKEKDKSRLGWFIGYHYIVYGDGTVRQYRGHDEIGIHCKESKMNFQSIGICMVGDFSSGEGRRNELPSLAQITSLTNLVTQLQREFGIPDSNLAPHRKYALNPATKLPYKDCYGNKLPDNPLEILTRDNEAELAIEWMLTHELLKIRRGTESPVKWGELAIISKRLTERILDWTRNPKNDDKIS